MREPGWGEVKGGSVPKSRRANACSTGSERLKKEASKFDAQGIGIDKPCQRKQGLKGCTCQVQQR
jgi:hypothetical protein